MSAPHGGNPWAVQISSTAVGTLDRLPRKVAAAVVEFCTAVLPENPYLIIKPLRYELEGWHVARRGDYRVLVQIVEEDLVLLIGRIEHRADVYRPH